MSGRTCPAPGCISPVGSGKFGCRAHWFALPKPIRDEIWRTWRAVSAAKYAVGLSPEQRLGIIRDYRAACAAAEQWWSK